jgi:hypothetical protein
VLARGGRRRISFVAIQFSELTLAGSVTDKAFDVMNCAGSAHPARYSPCIAASRLPEMRRIP